MTKTETLARYTKYITQSGPVIIIDGMGHIDQMASQFYTAFSGAPEIESPKELTLEDVVKTTLRLDKEEKSHNWKKNSHWGKRK